MLNEEPSLNEDEILLKVDGMMCEHCERRVRECLESLPFIESAVPDYKTGFVKVKPIGETDMKTVKSAIKKAGYKLL